MSDKQESLILKVCRLGHPVLRQVAKPVNPKEITTRVFQELIDHMIVTMREYDGVGLAAPQIHISKQIAVIEVKNNLRYPDMDEVPLTVLINPKISSRSSKLVESWEGCLSIPEMRGLVPRNYSLVCDALDRKGNLVKIKAEDFFARVIQHEFDHLQGSVYLDRMPHMKTLSYLSEFMKFQSK